MNNNALVHVPWKQIWRLFGNMNLQHVSLKRDSVKILWVIFLKIVKNYSKIEENIKKNCALKTVLKWRFTWITTEKLC